jgi:hypothetical protein
VGLVADHLDEDVEDEAHRPEDHPATLAIGAHARGDVDDRHARQRELVKDQVPDVPEIAAQAAEVVDDELLEPPLPGIREQSLQIAALRVGS